MNIATLELPFFLVKIYPTTHRNNELIVHAYPNFDTVFELKDLALLFKIQTQFKGRIPKSVAVGIFATEETALQISKFLPDRFIGTNPNPFCIFGSITREILNIIFVQ